MNRRQTKNFIETLRKYHELIFFLTYREIRIRYKQAALGASWAVLQPFVQMVVYTLVFSHIGKISVGDVPYPVFVLCGLLPWGICAGAISRGVPIITNYSNLVTKIYFPREIFPIFAVLGLSVDFLCSFLVLILLFFVYQIPLHLGILASFLVIVTMCVFIMGVLFFLATANVFYRDVSYAVSLIVQVWFFMTPVAYPLEKVPYEFRFWYDWNPMVGFVSSYRDLLLNGSISNPQLLIQSVAISILIFISGYQFLKHYEMKFGDII